MVDVTITCVVNDVARPESCLREEHGLAMWLATPDGEVLFDTGQSGPVLRHNLERLGLDPASLDGVVVSHGHDDHTGGLPWVMATLPNALPLYGNADLLTGRFKIRDDTVTFHGVPVSRDELAAALDLRLDDAPQEVLPGLRTTGAIEARPHPIGAGRGHAVRCDGDLAGGEYGGEYAPDPYRDDLSMVLTTAAGLVVLCGCCHAGLLNTLEHVRHTFEGPIVAIIGGTHLVNAADAALGEIVATLRDWGTVRRLYLNHCSGSRALHRLQGAFGDVVQAFPAGSVARFEAVTV